MLTKAIILAKTMAMKSNMTNKHGAVLINGGKICGYGYNHINYDHINMPNYRYNTIASIHAEIDCLRSCIDFIKRKKKRYIMVIVRISKDGDSFLYSKPCSLCLDMLRLFRVRKILYTEDDGSIRMVKISELTNSYISKGVVSELKRRMK